MPTNLKERCGKHHATNSQRCSFRREIEICDRLDRDRDRRHASSARSQSARGNHSTAKSAHVASVAIDNNFASVTDAVEIAVVLVGICHRGAVVFGIGNAIAVAVLSECVGGKCTNRKCEDHKEKLQARVRSRGHDCLLEERERANSV